jgi:Tol biopolymer transport system component
MTPTRVAWLLSPLAVLAVACSGGGSGASVEPATVVVEGEPGLILYRLSNEGTLGVVDADGSGRRHRPVEVSQSAFLVADCSADGGSLAYVVGDFETNTGQLYLLDGAPEEAPIPIDALVQTLAMSPDGRRVAITVFDTETLKNRLWLMELPGGEVTVLPTGDGSPGAASWSPDGTRLAFSSLEGRESNLYVLEIGADAPQRVSDRDVPAYDPDWSPDGESLLFASQVENQFVQLFRVDANGENERQITTTETLKSYPRWSNDGSLIAFVGSAVLPAVSTAWEAAHILAIWVAAPDGAGERQLTDLALDARLMAWCEPGPWLDESWAPQ